MQSRKYFIQFIGEVNYGKVKLVYLQMKNTISDL